MTYSSICMNHSPIHTPRLKKKYFSTYTAFSPQVGISVAIQCKVNSDLRNIKVKICIKSHIHVLKKAHISYTHYTSSFSNL